MTSASSSAYSLRHVADRLTLLNLVLFHIDHATTFKLPLSGDKTGEKDSYADEDGEEKGEEVETG